MAQFYFSSAFTSSAQRQWISATTTKTATFTFIVAAADITSAATNGSFTKIAFLSHVRSVVRQHAACSVKY